jgi:hypothetical protein
VNASSVGKPPLLRAEIGYWRLWRGAAGEAARRGLPFFKIPFVLAYNHGASRGRLGEFVLWMNAAVAVLTTGLAFLAVRSDQQPLTNLLFLAIPAAFGALTALEYRAKRSGHPSSAWVAVLVFGSLLAIVVTERIMAPR